MKKIAMLFISFVAPLIFVNCLLLSIYMERTEEYYKTKYSNQINIYYRGYVGEEPPAKCNDIGSKLFELTSKAYFKGNAEKIKKSNNND